MIKLLQLIRRKPDLTVEEFQAHWLEVNGRLTAASPAVVRHVQYHRLLDDPMRAALAQAADSQVADAYDGLSVVWANDAEALVEGLAAAFDDEANFVDAGRSVHVVAEEHVHIEPAAPSPIVLVECLARLAEIDRQTFSRRWLEHAGIAHRANKLGLLAGYVQSHALANDDPRRAGLPPSGAGDEDWDGIVTAYFQSVAIAKRLFGMPLASEEAYEDEKTFFDHSKAVHLLTRRHVVKDLVR
jgi:hypothetical protein